MTRTTLTRFAAAALLVATGACSTDSPTALDERMPDARTFNAVDPTGQEAYILLCKLSYEAFEGVSPDLTTGRDFAFNVSGDPGDLVESPVTLTAYDGGFGGSSPNPEYCEIVWAGDEGTTVTIEEVNDGYTVLRSAVWEIEDGSRPALTEVDDFTRSLEAAPGRNIVLFKNETLEEPPQGFCTYTIGYWKTHSENGPAPYDATWALLPNGANTMFYLSGQSWYQVFWTPVSGNQYYNLAHQFMGSVLNVLNDAGVTSGVADAILAANVLFNTYTPGQVAAMKGNNPVRQQFVTLAGILASYNEGLIGPGHCDDETDVN